MGIVEDYLEYTNKYCSLYGEKTLVLMQVGSFFECYALIMHDGSYWGSHIQEFANINDMVISKKNVCVGDLNVVMAGFGINQLEKYVKKMQNAGYTIPVFVQDIQGKNTTRSLSCIYSPGTFFNTSDYTDNQSDFTYGLTNNTICIWIHITEPNKITPDENITFGISIIDILTGKLIVYEYTHQYINNPSTYDQLEKYISIYNPSETIIITNNNTKNVINDTISYCNIMSTKIHKICINNNDKLDKKDKNYPKDDYLDEYKNGLIKVAENCEKQNFQESIIDKIYGIGSFREKSEFYNYPIANQSITFLLDFVEKHNLYLVKQISLPIYENCTDKLILANHSLKQLNIISDQRYNGKLSCVCNFLNNCITSTGKRKFNYTLLNPISNIDKLNHSYKTTNYIINGNVICDNYYEFIRNNLKTIKDLEKIERKLIMKTINPKDFIIMYNDLKIMKEMWITFKQDREFLNYIQYYIDKDIENICDKIIKFIEQHFNIDKAITIVIDKLSNYNLPDLNFINNNFNNELNISFKNSVDSREQFEAIRKYLSNLLFQYEKPKISKQTKQNKVTKSNITFSYDNEDDDESNYVKIHETSKMDAILIATKRRVIILKEIIEKIIKNNGSHINIKYISKYSNNEEILNLDLTTIEFKMHGNNQSNMIISSKHINEIAYSIQNSKDILINKLIENYNVITCRFIELNNKSMLMSVSEFIGIIDLFQCRAYNANKYNYCCPIIEADNSKSDKSYVKFDKMRHCLIEHLNDRELYVTNSLDFTVDKNSMLLYGTNAVGKTSLIKSIGINIILAQSGMFVPATNFIFYPYNYLFTRILGNDNIFKGLSTFAVEMCELRTILKQATENSIILGDELCSGTETTSALSIFVSGLEKLYNIGSTFIFATHFHEVLKYDEIISLKNMMIYHMTVIYDKKTKLLIYDRKLKYGAGLAMYGLEVCKSLDLPDDFIERAYEIRNKYLENMIDTTVIKKSRYNNSKIHGMCEICNIQVATEVHHLQYQKQADSRGIINNEFHKNKKANLINICNICHDKIHHDNIEYKITKTSNGYKLMSI
jgi:DNA mismatch repair protein MutS